MRTKEQEKKKKNAPQKEVITYMPPEIQVEDLHIEQSVLQTGSSLPGGPGDEPWT